MQQPKPVKGFQGNYRWLSNFWLQPVTFDGIEYASSEHAYQAAKMDPAATTIDPATEQKVNARAYIATLTPGQAKRFTKGVTLPPNWHTTTKFDVMEQLLRQKFTNPELRRKLLATGNAHLEETNRWHDCAFGVCVCPKCKGQGENRLGKILMKIRSEIGGNNVPKEREQETQDQPE